MTALNLIVRPNAAYILADRAGCGFDGVVQQIAPKIIVSRQLRIAVGHTGISTPDFAACKADWLAKQPDQTEALATLPKLLRELVALNDVAVCGPDAKHVEGMPYVVSLVVAMWSPVFDRAGGGILTSGGGHLPNHVPEFTLWPARQYIQPSVPTELQPRRDWLPYRDALPLIEAQRRIPSPWGTNHIGGGVDLAVVDASSASLRSLHTYPDRVGAPIAV